MRAGQLRQIIKILRTTDSIDELGTVVPNFSVLKTTRASISPISGNEYFINSALVNDETHYIIIRKADVTPKDRLQHGNDIYDITQVLDTRKMGIECVILAKQRLKE